MKMLVDTDKMYTLKLSPDGQLAINLANGRAIQGTLTPEEQEVIAVAVTRVSERVIEFDPKPNDYIALHLADIQTLEQQALAIEELRTELDAGKEAFSKQGDVVTGLQASLDAALKELDAARPQLRDASLVVQEQATQLVELRSELTSAKHELNGVKGELLQMNELVQKQRDVINATAPSDVTPVAAEAESTA